MRLSRRDCFGRSATLAASIHLVRKLGSEADGAVTPEQFGAARDGRTNDFGPFARMAAAINRRSGGAIPMHKGDVSRRRARARPYLGIRIRTFLFDGLWGYPASDPSSPVISS